MTHLDLHAAAQDSSSRAALLAAKGDAAAARSLFALAADQEESAYLVVPADKTRTRAIFAVSLVSLLYKARQLDRAERWCYRLLADDGFSESSRAPLRELLEVITDERLLLDREDREYVGGPLTVSMRGGLVGWGTAPLDATLEYAAAASAWIYRLAEYKGGYPFRVRGRPPSDVLSAIQARTTQASAGSYRFGVRLTQPVQTDLFSRPRIEPAAVTEGVFRFVALVNAGDVEGLKVLVPDEQHRTGLLKVLRNLVPEGRTVGEIEFIRPAGGALEVARLAPRTRALIRRHLAASAVHRDAADESVELRGVLRGLHLDQNWLVVHADDGRTMRCDAVKDMLDDVVGPMVNRRVAARGRWRRKNGAKKLLVEDIELASEDGLEQ